MSTHIPATLPEITAAALLHDIGKLVQRTRENTYRDPDEANLCPFSSRANHFTHIHALYTSGFLKTKQHIFPADVNPDRIVTLAAKHHMPDTPYQWIIAEADRLSSGADRSAKEIAESDNRFYEQPARSIFDKISINGDAAMAEHFYPLTALEPDRTEPAGPASISKHDYTHLLSQLENDLDKLQNLKTDTFFSALDTILEHYCWSVPSSTIDEPDISLYDHLRTTAALASVLYRYHGQKGDIEDTEQIRNRDIDKYLLVTGDLSGIQHYLFDIRKSKFAAKILRARSFELQAFAESVSRYILRKLKLPECCRIMNAGGRFLLLLPNTDHTKTVLAEIRKQVDTHALRQYLGELTLNLSPGVVLSGNMLMQKRAQHLFAVIAADTQEAKTTRLQTVLNRPEDHILGFYYDAFRGSGDECPLCEKRPTEGNELCASCRNLRDVGGKLPKASCAGWLPTDSGPSDAMAFPWKDSLRLAEDMQHLPPDTLPMSINAYQPGFPVLTTPYHVPTSDRGDILTFEELGELATGAPHIAMLKADVDNLGAIFSIGLGDRVSLSRFTSLSRMMNYFFTSLLNELIATRFPRIYVIYSGGDDLCMVGPWSDIVIFASELNTRFAAFTGGNPDITLSAGITLAHTGTPVLHMTEEAEHALDTSKRAGKNRCTLFGVTVPWNIYEKLLDLHRQWLTWIQKDKLPKSLVYRLLGYHKARRDAEENGNVRKTNALWQSHLHYDTARNIDDPDIRSRFLEQVITHIDHLPIPASIILYKTRSRRES